MHYCIGIERIFTLVFIYVPQRFKSKLQADNIPTMHRRGAIKAIQYPEQKVLPSLTQGRKQI